MTKNPQPKLFRTSRTIDSPNLPKKVFIVGNGAVLNGNKPIDKWIKTLYPAKTTLFDAPSLGSNKTFSCLVAEETSLLLQLFACAEGKYPISSNNLETLISMIAANISARCNLGDMYTREEIQLNPKMLSIMINEGITEHRSAVATTNWDLSLWNYNTLKDLIYLHGRCDLPYSMIFPTQMWEFLNHLNHLGNSILKNQQILNAPNWDALGDIFIKPRLTPFPEENGGLEIYTGNNLFSNWFSAAEEWYFCGIAFNDYDHELLLDVALIARVRKDNSNLPKVTIINRQNPKVANDKFNKIKLVSCITHVSETSIKFIDTES